MKKLSFLLISLCLVLFGCPHNAEISDGEKTVQGKQYDTISSLAYIGGSVVYNPSNPLSAQLYNGANIAIYHSELTKTQESAEALIEGKTETETWTTKTVDTFSIDREKDIYGYLKIQAVSSEAIVFDYHRFQSPEKKVVKSYSLKKNQTLDLDKDDRPDLKYTPLLPVRENFEGAMCLEFISNQEALYSTMYGVIIKSCGLPKKAYK